MDPERIDEVTDWEERPFADGFAGLRTLADRGFSGAVTDGRAWLFLLNGRVVGVSDGELEAFADADGTAYDAPHDALALLYAMKERGGDLRAQYYTNDTPLSQAHRKLESGNFTGYVELSENVLSGDYYTVYHGGNSMSVAVVGAAERLETGDDAFELADDEVGIYEVYDVDLDVREVPDPAAGGTDAGGDVVGAATDADAGAEADAGAADESARGSDPGPSADAGGAADTLTEGGDWDAPNAAGATAEPDADAIDAATGVEDGTGDDANPAGAEPADPDRNAADGTPAAGNRASTADAAEPRAVPDASHDTAGDGSAAEAAASEETPRSGTEAPAGTEPAAGTEPDAGSSPSGEAAGDEPTDAVAGPRQAGAEEGPAPAGGDGSDVFSQEAEWREAKSIPALDPEESSTGGPERRGSGRNGGSPDRSGERDAAATTETEPEPANGGSDEVSERPSVRRNRLQRRVQRLESALEETESRRQELEADREKLAADRDRYRERAEELESTVEELRDRVRGLERELEDARSKLPDGDRSMSPSDALAATNLFVRYDSQGGATLEAAHDGSADREEVNANLRLENHTSFESDDVLVDGEPYREFLADTIEYGFTRWIVEDLLYEIRETGNVGAMREIYDAIPEIDRAEIGGEVSVAYTDGGEEHREQRSFDLVLRDRMGNPLMAADLNGSRDPTVEGKLDSLVSDAGLLAESNEGFAAAFAVTASFFEPGALEAVEDATGGGLFSRGKQKSYVKLSRKQGYHLCLVETRDGEFHLNVPEL